MKYKKSHLADEDIINIYQYTYQNFGPLQAETYHENLHNTFCFLAENPLVAPEQIEFVPPVRIHHYKKHLIVYLIQEDGIFIVRVLHERMDVKLQLENDYRIMKF